jgi:hypothetical protein
MFQYSQYEKYSETELLLKLAQALLSGSNGDDNGSILDADAFITEYCSTHSHLNIVMLFDGFDLSCSSLCQFIESLSRHDNIRVIVTTASSPTCYFKLFTQV